MTLPIVDLSEADTDPDAVATAIDRACRDEGFFVLVGHGIAPSLVDDLTAAATRTFALPAEAKERIAMARGGRAWRGWFPLGAELTSGRPDRKEGLYFGTDLAADHPRVDAGTPLHGANLVPSEVPELGPLVDRYIAAATEVGQRVLSLVARGLGLSDDWFRSGLTAEPTVLFRIFRYPPADPTGPVAGDEWGVAEHTDYGLLTLLHQDHHGGLQVHTREGWIDAPPVPGAFVCNLGDMLERMTAGAYRSTPHRVRNPAAEDRISFPLFLDPGWDEPVRPIPGIQPTPTHRRRWDGAEPLAWNGTYGDYLSAKVSRVFPELFDTVATTDPRSQERP